MAIVMSVSSEVCQRCGKGLVGPACPHCTVTGVDLEALLNAEERMLLQQHRDDEPDLDKASAKSALEDLVSGKTLRLISKLCKVGRDLSNDISLAGDRSVSRFHFQISLNGSDYYIEDCGSRNGTFLNGSPIAVPKKLQDGDVISAGMGRYRFIVLSADDLQKGNTNYTPSGTATASGSSSSKGQTTFLGAGQANPASSNSLPGSAAADSVGASARLSPQSDPLDSLNKLRANLGVGPGSHSVDTVDLEEKMFLENREFKDSGSGSIVSTQFVESADGAKNKRSPDDSKSVLASGHGAPNWLEDYSFPEFDKMLKERNRLNGLLEEIRYDIKQMDRKIAAVQTVTQALLSGQGLEMAQACKMVLEALEWTVESAAGNPQDLTLRRSTKVDAVLKIVVVSGDPTSRDFEALVNQQAVVWCQLNYEPKGIMLVQLCAEMAPSARPELGADFLESMRRKKICVIQSKQLLAIHRQVVFNNQDKNFIRELLLNTCGLLPGFTLKSKDQESRAAS